MPGTAAAAVRRTAVVIALAFLALIGMLLPNGAAARAEGLTSGARVGFSNGAGLMWQSDAELARDLDLMVASGARWVRLDFDWSGVEGTRGRYDWKNLDRVVGAARARGLQVLALPAYTPSWARPAGTTTHHPPIDPAHFAAFAGAAAARYVPQGVTVWEIWNEPNIPNFWEPKPDVAGYAQLLRLASAAIRAAAPGTTVLTAGLSPASDTADGRYVDPRTFVSTLYRLGVGSSFDGVGVHPYSFPALPSDASTASWNTFQKMTTIRQTMVAHGDSAKKIWLTETGAPTGGDSSVSEQRQADIITDTIRATEGLSWAGPVFLYAARDAGTDRTDREDNFGLVRRDFSPKPAWAALLGALATAPVAAPAPVVAEPVVETAPGEQTAPVGVPRTAPVTPPSVSVLPAAISAGQPVTVTYRGTPGAVVDILSRTQPATTFSRIGSVTLDGTGTATSTHAPQKNTRITARSASGEVSSEQPIVAVRSVASLSVQRVGTRTYAFTGRVYPALDRRLVNLYRNGVLVAQGRSDATGIYRITKQLPGGTFTFQVRTPNDQHNLGAGSPLRRALVF